jgi:hypothetical protein
MGRPPTTPEKARSQRVVTYVTRAELAGLERIAEREGRPLSKVVHRILARSLDRRRCEGHSADGPQAETPRKR